MESNIFFAYPTPTSDFLNISIENTNSTNGTLTLVNALGQVLSQQVITLSNGQGTAILDLRNITKGVYSISFQTHETIKVQKVIKE